MKMRHIAAGLLLSVLINGGVEAATFYTTTSSGTALGRIDTVTGAATVIGPTGFSGTYGLALDNTTGVAYGIVNANALATFNLTTGAATLIENLGVGFNYSLEISPTGTLFAAAWDDRLYTVNKLTGATTFVGSMGVSGFIFDLAFDTLGNLYGTNAGTLYKIDTITGVATTVTNFETRKLIGNRI